jgi:YgiT-type zinc finger domain-containing protein
MICVICRELQTMHGFVSTVLERDEMRLVIRRIPAQVCPHCGEAFVEEWVAARLLQTADAVLKTGILDASIDYNDPTWQHDAGTVD